MIRNRNNVSSFITKDRSKIWELFHPSSSPANGFSVAEALVEPGQETDAHRHILSQEIYYILEGTGKMRVDKELSDVSAGDAVFMKPGMAHNVKNTGSGPLRILCICCPHYSHEDTVLVKTQKI